MFPNSGKIPVEEFYLVDTPAENNLIGVGGTSQVVKKQNTAVKKVSKGFLISAVLDYIFANSCTHPGIIKYSNIKASKKYIKLEMKLYKTDLHDYISNGVPKLSFVSKVVKDLVSAVAYIHARGIIHCDIKPENILLEDGSISNDKPIAILCDFGISVPSAEKYHCSKVQTCTYRAPEVNYEHSKTRFTNRIDVWSIGCIIFELLSGKLIYDYCFEKEDPTLYACELFDCEGETRFERLKSLKKLPTRCVKSCLLNKMDLSEKRLAEATDCGLIGVMVKCLSLNWRKRPSAMDLYKLMYSREHETVVPLVSNPDIEKTITKEINYISKNTKICLAFAEQIYRELSRPESKINAASSAIFIAGMLNSGSFKLIDWLIDQTNNEIPEPVIEAMKKINWGQFTIGDTK